MAAGGNNICGIQNVAGLLINEKLLDSFWLPKSSPSLLGPISMANFESVGGGGTTSTPPFQSLDEEGNAYEDFDGFFNPPGKKRRLTSSQVQFLEKNFEEENKLEPERKVQLAKELGLQPRQVAIWFQNRRARSKNQRLENDYDSLKAVYDKLKDDYDTLLKEKQVLQNEVHLLKDKLLVKEKGKENLETFDAFKLLDSESEKTITNTDAKTVSHVPMENCKQEDANSAKSDVLDSDSPHYTGNHSSLIDPADSSQDEDDNNHSKGILPPPYFLKQEEDCCYDDHPPTNSSNFGFSMEDQSFWSWHY